MASVIIPPRPWSWASGYLENINIAINTMKLAIIFGVILLTLGAYQKPEQPPEIGSKLRAKDVPKKTKEYYMTHSAQFRPFIKKEINKIEYLIAYNQKTREVTYLSTTDPDFRSAQGLKVGDYIELKGDVIQIYPGWEVRGPEDEDGWQPLIGFDSELTVLRGQTDFKLKVPAGQYRLPAGEIERIRIMAFVKGGN